MFNHFQMFPEWGAHLSPVCLVKKGWGWLTQICPGASRRASQNVCIYDWLGDLWSANHKQGEIKGTWDKCFNRIGFFDCLRRFLHAYVGCNLVLDVTLEAVHLWAFLGVSYDTVQLIFWVSPHRPNLSHLSTRHKDLNLLNFVANRIKLNKVSKATKKCPEYI